MSWLPWIGVVLAAGRFCLVVHPAVAGSHVEGVLYNMFPFPNLPGLEEGSKVPCNPGARDKKFLP